MVRPSKKSVIPSQCEHCVGISRIFRLGPITTGDCHTSDIGHWFAMTSFLTRRVAPCFLLYKRIDRVFSILYNKVRKFFRQPRF